MNFYKILIAFTILLLVFSSNAFSMNNDEDLIFSEESKHSSLTIPIKDVDESSSITNREKSCSHWGLTRWVYGIGEYLQRSLCFAEALDCCFDTRDPERKYIVREERSRWEIEHGQEARVYASSDCAFINCLSDGSEEFIIEGIRSCCLIPCCPLATLTHLCCLPCACSEHSKKQEIQTRRSRSTYIGDTRTQEERAISERAAAIRQQELSHSNCQPSVCFGGVGKCTKHPSYNPNSGSWMY